MYYITYFYFKVHIKNYKKYKFYCKKNSSLYNISRGHKFLTNHNVNLVRDNIQT